MPRIIGLTGNIACGKSSVGHMLLELGADHYIDADTLVHQLYQKDQSVIQEIVAAFGTPVLNGERGGIDRQALGRIVFENAHALAKLEAIVHPAVKQALLDELEQVHSASIVIFDAIKLLEGRSGALCQSKWLVLCCQEQEIIRLMKRNRLNEHEAMQRLRMQPDVSRKIKLVDEVITNDGSLAETRVQVLAAFQRFCQAFPV